jgi:hypothetical protein
MNTVTYRKYAEQFKAAKAAGTTQATSVKAFIAELHTVPAPAPVVEAVVVEAPPVKRGRGRPANPNKPVVVKRVKKTDVALRIFEEELAKANGGEVPRKTLVERLVAEAELSTPGANTYITNLRRSHGLLK